jgi:hypothetical protein
MKTIYGYVEILGTAQVPEEATEDEQKRALVKSLADKYSVFFTPDDIIIDED